MLQFVLTNLPVWSERPHWLLPELVKPDRELLYSGFVSQSCQSAIETVSFE